MVYIRVEMIPRVTKTHQAPNAGRFSRALLLSSAVCVGVYPISLQNLQIDFNVWFVFRLEMIKHWSICQNNFALASSLSLYSTWSWSSQRHISTTGVDMWHKKAICYFGRYKICLAGGLFHLWPVSRKVDLWKVEHVSLRHPMELNRQLTKPKPAHLLPVVFCLTASDAKRIAKRRQMNNLFWNIWLHQPQDFTLFSLSAFQHNLYVFFLFLFVHLAPLHSLSK